MAVTNDVSNNVLDQLGVRNQKKKTANNELGQDAFLKLMITQMKHQNPLEPQKNSEFVAQLAQFSSVEGLEKLNASVNGLVSGFESSRALQASSLVGKTVKVLADKAYLSEDSVVSGTVEVPASTNNLKLNVYNKAGELVWNQGLGPQAAGDVSFNWDGELEDGTRLAEGEYTFEAIATVDGKPVQLNTYLASNVNSVTLGSGNAMTLNVAGIGPVSISDVKEIM